MSYWKHFVLFPAGERERLPVSPGVYAVYFNDSLVYIGQSVNVANRFSEHRIRFGYDKSIITPWESVPQATRITVKVRACRRLGEWAMREIRLIRRLGPAFNGNYRKPRAQA